MSRLTERLLSLFYPPKCPFCARVLEQGEDGLCRNCQPALPWVGEDAGARAVEHCAACLSPLWYQDGVRQGVHRYKFQGGQVHARLFGALMAQCLQDRWREPVDLITWVPLSRQRLRQRGYDQAELLARRVGEVTGLPVAPTLVKIRNTRAQSRLNQTDSRAANIRGAYAVEEGLRLTGRRVVLVDDVVTSGATLSQCAACLRAAGASSVITLTLARAR